MKKKSLSIIIPCYNEGKKIIDSINCVKKYLEKEFKDFKYEIIVVNDGSTDIETNNVLNKINIDKVNCISYKRNQGKGYAIKKGIAESKNDIIIFMDADLSTELSGIKIVVDNIEKFDMVIGSRRHKFSHIKEKQPFHRRVMGTFCIYVTRFITGLKIKDTQCGFKGLKKRIAKDIIKKQRINRWAFDVEYLYIASLNNYTIKEIPVTWCNDKNSTVNPISSSLSFIKELIKIRKNKKYYKNR